MEIRVIQFTHTDEVRVTFEDFSGPISNLEFDISTEDARRLVREIRDTVGD